MKRYSLFAIAFSALLLPIASSLNACTGIKLKANDGTIVHGRTLEFGVPVETSAVVIPRDYEFTGTTPKGPGLIYKSKYAAVGAMAYDILSIMDGMNEKGLAIGAFYFPGFAEYPEITPDNQSKALSPIEFPNWVLTQFADVDELRVALNNVVIAPTIEKAWGETPIPLHYIVIDKNGHGLTIEPVKGKWAVYDNPIGVLTNSPGFDWHMTNLRNYINLTTFNIESKTLRGVELTPFGQGSGMVGLPGDFTPPSRFVRAVIFSVTAIPSEKASDSVYQAFHILNQFDIPVGAVNERGHGKVYSDATWVTCVRDPQALKYFFKTFEDQDIRVVDLNKFDLNAKEVKKVITSGKQKATDISASLQ